MKLANSIINHLLIHRQAEALVASVISNPSMTYVTYDNGLTLAINLIHYPIFSYPNPVEVLRAPEFS